MILQVLYRLLDKEVTFSIFDCVDHDLDNGSKYRVNMYLCNVFTVNSGFK